MIAVYRQLVARGVVPDVVGQLSAEEIETILYKVRQWRILLFPFVFFKFLTSFLKRTNTSNAHCKNGSPAHTNGWTDKIMPCGFAFRRIFFWVALKYGSDISPK